MSELNLPLLRECVEWAEMEAKQGPWSHWYQGCWALPFEEVMSHRGVTLGEGQTACGTAYCIAGYAVYSQGLVAGRGTVLNMPMVSEKCPGVECPTFEKVGTHLLGLTWDEASRLFSGMNTIEQVREIAEGICADHGVML